MRTSSGADSRQLVTLRPMSTADRDAVLAGNDLPGITTVPDYPTEFSQGMAPMVGTGSPLGPFLVLRSDDDVVVGDIGGGFTAPGEAEIGYAIARSCWGRHYASAAVATLIERARETPQIEERVGHTPLDRPASGRVLHRTGFTLIGEVQDEHDGQPVRVQEWRLRLRP